MPEQPSPQEQKEQLEEAISGIEEIMSRQDESLSPEEREKESKMWAELMQTLQAENENLNKMVETEDSPEAGTEPETADGPAASDPNESE
jgi:hypothetical protein